MMKQQGMGRRSGYVRPKCTRKLAGRKGLAAQEIVNGTKPAKAQACWLAPLMRTEPTGEVDSPPVTPLDPDLRPDDGPV